ncbi:glucosaminidase domain-containing protein [Vibrio sp. HB161653]|uniref:glucosaminidase domain-containing protein n=1 Tax=Vibrio sp. HB161653 TaxID=3068274 RepID=UPI00273D3E10|nr:glucosaminidase domain-containing protein [Vibrio sp. HB161653]MDP5253407.1 glucosaminidase domain-containing protein [Vibrio sp. HB161653]
MLKWILKAIVIALGLMFCLIGPARFYYPDGFETLNYQFQTQSATTQEHRSSIPDFAAISDANEKKRQFFQFLLPMVEAENKRIEEQRAFLLSLRNQTKVSKKTLRELQKLAQHYDLPLTEKRLTPQWLDSLLERVNVLPPALVLIQAANESAWGTSRFARQGNNLFGQWCYSQGCGLVPKLRGSGKTHEVAAFSSVQESVSRYFLNINTNQAYQGLRRIRAELSQSEQALTTTQAAYALTQGLENYSERGQDYIEDLQSMIRHNENFWTASQS